MKNISAKELDEWIDRVEASSRRKILDLSMQMTQAYNRSYYPLDNYVYGIANRTLALVSGFCCLLKDRNFTCAAPVLRMHIDSTLRLYAVFLVVDPHTFANDVMAGKRVRDVRDRDGKKMTDTYLVQQISKTFPWIERVYERTCGYVHFSDTHISTVFDKVSDDGRVEISVTGCKVPETYYPEIIEAFEAATRALAFYFQRWVNTKDNPHMAERFRDGENEVVVGEDGGKERME